MATGEPIYPRPSVSFEANITGANNRPEFVDAFRVQQDFHCGLCYLCLVDPMQTACGVRVCRECISAQFLPGEESIACPLTHNEPDADANDLGCTNGLTKSDIYGDPATKRLLYKERVYCKNSLMGCHDQMEWRNLQIHMEGCDQAPGVCDICHDQFLNRFVLMVHQSLQCFSGSLPCYYCGGLDVYTVQEMAEHLKMFSQIHLESVTFRLSELERLYGASVSASEDTGGSLYNKYIKKHRQLEMYLAEVNDTLNECRGYLTRQTSGSGVGIGGAGNALPLPADLTPLTRRLDALEQRLQGQDIISLSRDLNELQTDFNTRIQKLEGDVNPCGGLNGVLIWRINNYKAKKDAGQALLSPLFYSGEAGYKMCARADLNGDGPQKGKCLSLFFVLARGTFDDLLDWPFTLKVTFSILCPGIPAFDYSHTFTGDGNDTTFGKPKQDYNKPIGIQDFRAISEVERKYLKNNSIYIRLKVHNPAQAGNR